MDINAKTRESAVDTRQSQKHRKANRLERVKETVKAKPDQSIQEEVRGLEAQQRQHHVHLQETLLERAKESLDKSDS